MFFLEKALGLEEFLMKGSGRAMAIVSSLPVVEGEQNNSRLVDKTGLREISDCLSVRCTFPRAKSLEQ